MRGDELGPLHGLPIEIMDMNDVAGLAMTYGSHLYKTNLAATDEFIVARLKRQGAIVVGKTNIPELGFGATSSNPLWGTTCNPHDVRYMSAGSSGGTAIALAAGLVPLAMGCDFAGNLRTPASFNGIAGIRPSAGTVANERRAFGFSPFNVEGPMGREAKDARLLLAAMASSESFDPRSFARDPLWDGPARQVDLARLKVAVSEDLGFAPVDHGVRRDFRAKLARFGGCFHTIADPCPDLSTVGKVLSAMRSLEFVYNFKAIYDRDKASLAPNVQFEVERGMRLGSTRSPARALILGPRVLLLDEPLGALDANLRRQLQGELKRVHRDVGLTFIAVTHDQGEALTMSDRIAVMRDGRIEQTGTPRNSSRASSAAATSWRAGLDVSMAIPSRWRRRRWEGSGPSQGRHAPRIHGSGWRCGRRRSVAPSRTGPCGDRFAGGPMKLDPQSALSIMRACESTAGNMFRLVPDPAVFVRGEGPWLFDADGRRILRHCRRCLAPAPFIPARDFRPCFVLNSTSDCPVSCPTPSIAFISPIPGQRPWRLPSSPPSSPPAATGYSPSRAAMQAALSTLISLPGIVGVRIAGAQAAVQFHRNGLPDGSRSSAVQRKLLGESLLVYGGGRQSDCLMLLPPINLDEEVL